MRLPFSITGVRLWDAYAVRHTFPSIPIDIGENGRRGRRRAGEDATQLQLRELPITPIMVTFATCSPMPATVLQLARVAHEILELSWPKL